MSEGDILGHEPMGIVEEVGSEVTPHQARRPGRDPVQHLLRQLLDVRPGSLRPVRDDPEPRPGQGRLAARLHEALRPGPRRPGRVPARPAGPLRPDQGPRGPARRPLPLPLRRAADRLAGGRVRRHAVARRGGRPRGLRARPDRADERPDRQAQSRPAGDRRRSRPGAAGDGRAPRHRGAQPRGPRGDLRHDPRDDRRARGGLDHRRGRHGGARRAGRRVRAEGRRPAPRQGRRDLDREGGDRPDGRSLPLHRLGAPRRDGLDQRGLRRQSSTRSRCSSSSTRGSRCGWARPT